MPWKSAAISCQGDCPQRSHGVSTHVSSGAPCDTMVLFGLMSSFDESKTFPVFSSAFIPRGSYLLFKIFLKIKINKVTVKSTDYPPASSPPVGTAQLRPVPSSPSQPPFLPPGLELAEVRASGQTPGLLRAARALSSKDPKATKQWHRPGAPLEGQCVLEQDLFSCPSREGTQRKVFLGSPARGLLSF